jgi:ubiquitin-protein ligase
LEELEKDKNSRYNISLMNNSDLFNWKVCFLGPSDSAYADANLTVWVTFPQNYPMAAPVIKFNPPLYHGNVDKSTGIPCLASLQSQNWYPSTFLKAGIHIYYSTNF